MPTPTSISFVVRTLNEAAFLGRLFDVLRAQQDIAIETEVIVVDSGSLDRTVEIARRYGATVFEVEKGRHFDYAKALNAGISRSRGELIAIVSAHAIPCSNDWLCRMVEHFEDQRVAGVYCRQLPWPNAYWREATRLARMFGDDSITFTQASAPSEVPFSNAASCIRRSVWNEQPFELPCAEDIEWATRAVRRGFTIIYESRVAVFHSHDESPRHGAHRLIDLEKAADIKLARRRGVVLTVRQAIGAVARDIRDIWVYTSSYAQRLQLVRDSVERSYWFIRDFGG
jgi:glycosyltransferase involved in cell wall biosynthesis